MDDETLAALIDHLGQHMSLTAEWTSAGCDGTLCRTIAWLEAQGLPIDTELIWLLQHGIRCDCDVLRASLPA